MLLVRSLVLRPVRLALGVLLTAFTLPVEFPSAAQAATSDTSAASAVLAGALGYEGGAYLGGFHPTAGTVEVSFTSVPLVLDKKVGSSGHFKIKLPAGTYKVVGCGPQLSPTANAVCGRAVTVTLTPGHVDRVRLVWALVP